MKMKFFINTEIMKKLMQQRKLNTDIDCGLFEISVNVSGYDVIVRGNVMNGVVRVGTMYIP